MHCTQLPTEQSTEQMGKHFLRFGFEEFEEKKETEEGRGPARSSEDKDGPNTARAPPTLQLSSDKTCGGVISTPGLTGAKTVGENKAKAQATSASKWCKNNSAK